MKTLIADPNGSFKKALMVEYYIKATKKVETSNILLEEEENPEDMDFDALEKEIIKTTEKAPGTILTIFCYRIITLAVIKVILTEGERELPIELSKAIEQSERQFVGGTVLERHEIFKIYNWDLIKIQKFPEGIKGIQTISETIFPFIPGKTVLIKRDKLVLS